MSWPLVKLRDCCEVVGGATPKREVPEYWDSPNVPWVTPKDVSDLACPTLEDAPEYISEAGFKSCSTSMLPKGSVLVTSRAPIGNIAIAGRDLCTNQGFKSLVPSARVDGLYLYYCMKHSSQRLQALGNGATFKEVSKKIVEEFEIPLPPLPEQKRIAAILDKADAIRRKRQQAIQLADDFLRAVFLDMFGDPVTNPKGWEVRPLIELIDPDRPITYGILMPGDDIEGGVPYIRVVDMKDGVVLVDQVRRTTIEIAQQYKRSSLRAGDVLMSIRGHVGRLAVVPKELEGANITQDTARLATNSNCSSLYLYACLENRKMQQEMQRFVKGAAVKGINLSDVKQLRIPVPPIELQKKIERKIELMTTALTSLEQSSAFLLDGFESLSRKAFSGLL
nr:restriction endonuclease subunit S [uncultured Pseudomonas sp.]